MVLVDKEVVAFEHLLLMDDTSYPEKYT